MTEPTFKIEVGSDTIDVTSYVVGDFNFTNSYTDAIPIGSFNLDDDSPNTFGYGDEVYFYAKIDSFVKKWGGYVSGIVSSDTDSLTIYDCKGFKEQAYLTDFTGRFRDDLGNGNMKDIITAIIDEKFPGWSYDDTSIPTIDIDFVVKQFQDLKVGSILDTFAKRANRIWYVDEDKKFWFIARSFTAKTSNITIGTNVVGQPVKDIDDSRFANVIKVLGRRFDVTNKEKFNADGTEQEITLSNFPTGSTIVEYTDGTQVSVAVEGAEDYNDSAVFDAYFKPDIPSIKFNAATSTSNGSLTIRYQFSSRIFEEQPNPASIDLYGFEVTKKIDDEAISTQEEAFNIAKEEGLKRNFVTTIWTVSVETKTQTEMDDWHPGNKILFNDGTNEFNYDILEQIIRWSKSSGLQSFIRLNDTRLSDNAMVFDLLRKITQRDNKEAASGTGITKTFYWGGNIYVSNENLSVDEVNADDGTFVLQGSINIPAPDNRSRMVDIIDDGTSLTGWSLTNGSITLNTNTFLTSASSINLIKDSSGTTNFVQKQFPNGVDTYGTNLIKKFVSCILFVDDSATLAKLEDPFLTIFDSGSNSIVGPAVSLSVGTNLVGLNVATATGTLSIDDILTYRLNINTINAGDTFPAGKIMMDNWIVNTGTFTISDYPGIMRDEFLGTPSIILSQNVDSLFRERFIDNFLIDKNVSSGTINTTAKTYVLGAGQQLRSRVFALEGTSFTTVKPTITFDTGTLSIELKNAGTTFETGTNTITHTYASIGDALEYRIINTGSGTITISSVFMEYA